ncbi:MAG: hypothetical protein ACSHX6_13365 [Akkermansiaceae bacterium]
MNYRVGLSFKDITKYLSQLHRNFALCIPTTLYLLITLITAIPTTTLGQANTAPPSKKSPNRIIDYTPAIDELLKIGFPNIKDTEGIKYVKVNDRNLEWTCSGFGFPSHDDNIPKLKGNGFHIPSKDKTKPDRFIYLGGCEIDYFPSTLKPTSNQAQQTSTRGPISTADLSQDLISILTWAQADTTHDPFGYNSESTFSAALGFAVLAHQAGHQKEATKLIKTLFLKQQDPEKIINTLINNLANREYNSVHAKFTQNTNWSEFHTSLITLQKKYPRGWANQPGLEILIPQVLSRVKNLPVPTPSIPGHTFSPEIQKLIDTTVKPTANTDEYYSANNLFVINPTQKHPKAPPFIQLTHHGMDGFIAIASMIGDETLMPQADNDGNSHYSNYYYNDDFISPQAAYQALAKPPTRGTKATSIIQSALPHNSQMLAAMTPAQLKSLAIEWWKKHRNDTKTALITHYLELGNQSHTAALIQSMMDQDTAESRLLLEKTILTHQRPSYQADIVKYYVKKRKSKAKDFLAKYKDILINAEKTTNTNSIHYSVRNAGGAEKFIESLTSYTEEIDPQKLLTDLAKKDAKAKQIMELLSTAYEGQALSEYINPLIQIAANKEETIDQMHILTTLLESSYSNGKTSSSPSGANLRAALSTMLSNHKAQEAKKETVDPNKPTLTPEQQTAWEKLLFSDLHIHGSKISSVAGMLLDKFTNPDRTAWQYESLETLGPDTIDKLIRERSKLILAGTPLSPLPDPDSINEERLTEMLKSLNAVAPAQLRQTLLAFNHSERIKLTDSEEADAIFTKGQDFIQGIGSVDPMYQPENLEQLTSIFQPIIGKKKNTDTYKQLATILLENADAFTNISIVITQPRTLPGLQLSIYNQSSSASEEIKAAQKDLLADKIDAFSAITAHDHNTDEATSLIFTNSTQPPADKLATFTTQNNLLLTATNKPGLEKTLAAQANTKDHREKLINEIISLQPALEEYRERFNDFSVEQLNQYKAQYLQYMHEQ